MEQDKQTHRKWKLKHHYYSELGRCYWCDSKMELDWEGNCHWEDVLEKLMKNNQGKQVMWYLPDFIDEVMEAYRTATLHKVLDNISK